MSRGRNAQSSRQIIIQQMLTAAGGQGLSPAEILERMKDRGYSVTKRTIHRDIEGLQVAGFPVTESGSKSDKGGIRWKVDISASAARSGHSSALKINPQQLAGLYLAKAQFKSMAQNPLFSGLDHFFEQVSDLIGSRNRALLDEFARTFHVAPTTSKVVESDPQVVETIQAAIQEGHCVSVRYQSANSGTDRTRKLGPHYVFRRPIRSSGRIQPALSY
jgi:predicted DNA-binding transcriptional regulator YafY